MTAAELLAEIQARRAPLREQRDGLSAAWERTALAAVTDPSRRSDCDDLLNMIADVDLQLTHLAAAERAAERGETAP